MHRRGDPVARIDFDDIDPVVVGTDPWLVLLEFALQLNDQLPGTPFDKLAADFGEHRPLLRRGNLAAGATQPVDLESIRKRAADQVPRRVATGLAESTGDRPIVLILDTTEEIAVPVARDVSDLWRHLASLIQEPRVRLILAGRYDLAGRSDGFAAAFPDAPVQEIEPFSASQADAYLRGRGITDPPLVAEIVRQSQGRPFKLALFGDIVAQRPDLTAEDVAAYRAPDLLFLVERVLDRIPDRGVRWLLRYGVIPRWLSLPLAREVLAPYLAKAMAGDPAFDDPAADADAAHQTPRRGCLPHRHRNPKRRSNACGTRSVITPRLPPGSRWRAIRSASSPRSSSRCATSCATDPPGRSFTARWQTGSSSRANEESARWGEWMAEAAYHRFQRDGEAAVGWWQRAARSRMGGRPDWIGCAGSSTQRPVPRRPRP